MKLDENIFLRDQAALNELGKKYGNVIYDAEAVLIESLRSDDPKLKALLFIIEVQMEFAVQLERGVISQGMFNLAGTFAKHFRDHEKGVLQ